MDPLIDFERAIINMPDGTILDVVIDKWESYTGDRVLITTRNGTAYLVSNRNCMLVGKKH